MERKITFQWQSKINDQDYGASAEYTFNESQELTHEDFTRAVERLWIQYQETVKAVEGRRGE